MKVSHHEPIDHLMLAIDIFIMTNVYPNLKQKLKKDALSLKKVPLNQFIKDLFLSKCLAIEIKVYLQYFLEQRA